MTILHSTKLTAETVIVGGGLVGGLCALLLAQAGVDVVLVDAAPARDVSDSGLQWQLKRDARVWALSPASLHLLAEAGVWSAIERHAPYYGMQVWSQEGVGQLEFGDSTHVHTGQSRDIETQLLGSMVEPSVLAVVMQRLLQEQLGSKYLLSTRVKGLERYSQDWAVTLEDDRVYRTPLVIGADGAGSAIRQLAGISTAQLDYHQHALTCAIRTEKPHQGVARQVFLPTGPLAFLPLANLFTQQATEQDHWQSVVWSLPSTLAQDRAAWTDERLMAAMALASGFVLGNITEIESRGIFPLRAQQARHYHLPGLVLIGDAAHVVHPMAGQGVNLGCLDVGVLVDALLHDRVRGLWAHEQTLGRYERARKLPNSIMMHGLSVLDWLQRTDLSPLMWLRGEGMHAVQQLPFLQHWFTQQASGRPLLKGTRFQING